MKKFILYILIFLPAAVSAQQVRKLQVIGTNSQDNPLNSIGIACIYDCENSIKDNNTCFNSASDTTINYFYASADSSSFAVTKAENLNELLGSLCEWKDLLILVHGYGDGIARLVNRESLLVDMYDMDVLVFCWPAMIDAGGKVQDYRATKDSIASEMKLFYRFLDEVGSYVRENKIGCSMLFHSLGNQFAMRLGRELGQNSDLLDISFIDNIVLNEACVPAIDYLVWAEPLSRAISGKLSITYNKGDIALSIARSFSEHQPLLGRGPTKKIPFTPSPKIRYVDFTKILRWQDPKFSHNFYVRQPLGKPEKAKEITDEYRKML